MALTDTVLSAAGEKTPQVKSKEGLESWCASKEGKREIHETWKTREAARH